MKKTLLLLAVSTLGLSHLSAQVLFTQDFTSSTTVGDYFSGTPTTGQFDDINTGANNTASIVSNALVFNKLGNNSAGWVRTTDLASNPGVLVISLNMGVSGNASSQTSGAEVVLQVGSGFGTSVSAESNSNVHSRIALNWTTTDGQWAIEPGGGGSASSNYTGAQTLTWVINNSGSSIDYTDPSTGTSTLANDAFDAWIGTTRELTSVTATTGSVALTDIKFAFNTGAENAAVYFNSISVSAVPEPSSIAALAGLAILGFVASRRRTRATMA